MTPPSGSPIRTPTNLVTGRLGAPLDSEAPNRSVDRLVQRAGIGEGLSESQDAYLEGASRRLLHLGSNNHLRSILTESGPQVTPAQLNTQLQEANRSIESGERTGYYHSLRALIRITDLRLNTPELRNRASQSLNLFTQNAQNYLEFFQNNRELSTLHRFRFLHSAARMARSLLGRVEGEESFAGGNSPAIQRLRATLGNIYAQLLDYAQSLSVSNPNDQSLTPLIDDIQMRQAELVGNHTEARSYGMRLIRHYRSNPLPSQPPETGPDRWIIQAGMETMEDNALLQIIPSLHQTSDAEITQMNLNHLTTELVNVVAQTIDRINEEEEETVRNRYEAFSAVVAALILANPGRSLREITQFLSERENDEAVNAQIVASSQRYPRVDEILNSTREHLGDQDLVQVARGAARHIQNLAQGPGRLLLGIIFRENEDPTFNRIARLETLVAANPQIIRDLELSIDTNDSEGAALELLRTGTQAVPWLANYGEQARPEHQNNIAAIIRTLSQPEDTQETVNLFLGRILEEFRGNMRDQSDHVFAGIHNSFQFLSELENISPDISIQDENRSQINNTLEEMNSLNFAIFDRATHHLTQSSSMISMLAGIAMAELLPAALIARAGAAGRLGPLVSGGVMTYRGTALTGVVTGLTMSVVGTSLHHQDRREQGLRSTWGMLGRDMAYSSALNITVFGGTLPFGRWLSASRLGTPAIQQGGQMGRVTLGQGAILHGGRRLAVHGLTAGFGGTLAWGIPTGVRGLATGDFTPSAQEVAESYMALAMFEAGSFGLRRVRNNIGLRAELRGTPEFEGMRMGEWIQTHDGGNTRFVPNPARQNRQRLAAWIRAVGGERTRGISRFLFQDGPLQTRMDSVLDFPQSSFAWSSRFVANRFNELTTVLGPYRMNQINRTVDHMIENNPDLGVYRDFLRYNLALSESRAPGSLDGMLREENGRFPFLENYRPMIDFETGAPRLTFLERAQSENMSRYLESIAENSDVYSEAYSSIRGLLRPNEMAQVNEAVDVIVENHPEWGPCRDFLRFELAQFEGENPGAMRDILSTEGPETRSQLERSRPYIQYDQGVPRLLFIETAPGEAIASEPVPEGLLRSVQRHLEDAVPGQGSTILGEVNGQVGQVLRVHFDPRTHQVLSIGRPPPAPEEGSPVQTLPVDIGIDTVTRELILPPTQAEGSPNRIAFGEHMDFYMNQLRAQVRFNPFGQMADANRMLPRSWNEGLVNRLTNWLNPRGPHPHRGNPSHRSAEVQQVADQIASGELPNEVQVLLGTDPREVSLSIIDPQNPPRLLPRYSIRLTGRVDAQERTLTLPATAEGQGEVVLNFEQGSLRVTGRNETSPVVSEPGPNSEGATTNE